MGREELEAGEGVQAEEAIELFVGLQDEAEVAGGEAGGGKVEAYVDGTVGSVNGGIGGSMESFKDSLEQDVAGGGFALELLPTGGGELVLALDGQQELFAAVELEIVFEGFEDGCDPGADGALGNT